MRKSIEATADCSCPIMGSGLRKEKTSNVCGFLGESDENVLKIDCGDVGCTYL